jgi:hypothetical protein
MQANLKLQERNPGESRGRDFLSESTRKLGSHTLLCEILKGHNFDEFDNYSRQRKIFVD